MKPYVCAIVLAVILAPFASRAQEAPAGQSGQSPVAPLATLASGAAVQASASPAVSAVDPEKDAAVRKLLDLTGGKAAGQQAVTQMISMSRKTLITSCGDNIRCQQLGNLLFAKMQANFNANLEDLQSQLIPIYTRHYSTDEINGLIQFYQTPLGQKMISVAPQAALEMQKTSYAWGQKLGADSMRQVLQEHPEFAPVVPASGH